MRAKYATWSRRDFLKATSLGSGALVLGFSLDAEAAMATTTNGDFTPNAWIRVAPDGYVEVLISKTEMGQGTATGMAMILAEELSADWSRVSVRTVQPDGKRTMITGGSYSIYGAWRVGRRHAAAAREMLTQAAAEQWSVPVAECIAERHAIVHRPSGRRAEFGVLVASASQLKVPDKPTLKDPKTYSLVGQSLPAKNLRDLVLAKATYGVDVRVPGMLYASIERAPVVNARIARVDDRAVRAHSGVRHVVKLRGNTFPTYNYVRDGVAIVADSSWIAMNARKKLRVEWNESWTDVNAQNGTAVSSKTLQSEFVRVLTQKDVKAGNGVLDEVTALRKGNVDQMNAALTNAAKQVIATYDLPLQAHAPMETMNATAHWQADRCELWVPCHFQTRLHDAIKELTGLPNEKVIVHTTAIGGSFGRRLEVDYAIEAVMLSREIGRPVQVLWTREDDLRFGSYAPPSKHRMRAALDASGNLLAFDHAFATLSVWKQQEPHELTASGIDFAAAFDAIKFPYTCEQLAIRHRLLEQTIRVFWWRRGYTPNHCFATECMLDECAHAAGIDPLAFRLRALPKNQKIEFKNKDDSETIDTARLANVLNLAAERADWKTPLPKGRGRGIAATVTMTHVAMVIEVTVKDRAIRVERVIVAVDCGIVINPQLVKAQVEGSVVFGLTAALKGAITVERGRVEQSNFNDYPLLTIDEMPKVETILVESSEPPTGTGEQISHPVAAALANAVFAATGERLRSLPLKL
jgi:isoquinoline 1-oxidoreductase subunit beta